MAQPTTVVGQPLPDNAELEKLQLHLTNEKLKVETAKLAREVQPERWWLKLGKNVLALGGLATIAATLYGVWDPTTRRLTTANGPALPPNELGSRMQSSA